MKTSPCPRCGADSTLIGENPLRGIDGTHERYRCPTCGPWFTISVRGDPPAKRPRVAACVAVGCPDLGGRPNAIGRTCRICLAANQIPGLLAGCPTGWLNRRVAV